MSDLILITLFAFINFLYIIWGIKNLPKERWQFFATIPKRQINEKDTWEGVNITYYGLLNANAYALSVALFLILNSMVGISYNKSILLALVVLTVCVPASKIVARIVEGKSGTLTIGGALFVGVLITPLVLTSFNYLYKDQLPIMPLLASMIISYTYGEALGRLACLSFGCCYGKKIDEVNPILRPFFSKFYSIFYGKTKKIAYEGNLEGIKVIPVQAITSLFFLSLTIVSVLLYMNLKFVHAFILCLVLTQVWRVYSEFLRADFRGNQKFTSYQIMAIINIVVGITILFTLKENHDITMKSVYESLLSIINLTSIFFLQFIWFTTLYFTGFSIVTSSEIKFKVNYDKI